MGRPKRLYPLGKFRHRVPKDYDKNTAYPVVLEYTWNREIKLNSDVTINHALTPILKACAYASELKMIDHGKPRGFSSLFTNIVVYLIVPKSELLHISHIWTRLSKPR